MAVWRTQHVVRLILRQSRSPALGFAVGVLTWSGVPLDTYAAELPVPCVAGSCGPTASAWVTSGSATANVSGNTLNVVQNSDRAILNWSSFNVDADGRVVFTQPNSSSIALNRIFQQSPSRIFGSVEANGQLYLINPNGMIFGATAKVNTAGLLASSLDMSDEVFNNGILSPKLLQSGMPALKTDKPYALDANGNPVLGADGKPIAIRVEVQEGASIKTSGSGGRVLLAGKAVENSGNITTPDGQVILAAGEKVFLQASADPTLRGLLVEVDAGGTAANQLKGVLTADHGNVTLVGLAVNQSGRISANTSVAANGSVRLLARDSTDKTAMETGRLVATQGGKLELGATSDIALLPDIADTATAVRAQEQFLSSATLSGKEVFIRGGSTLTASGGTVSINTAPDPTVMEAANAGSKVRVEAGATISVAGSPAQVPVERNLVSVELRANELADSPLQRNGALRGKKVIVDARVGTTLADVQGALDAVPVDVNERLSKGGTIDVKSAGDVFVDSHATFDVSGGAVNYAAGLMQTTLLLTADGKAVDIGKADPSRTYVGIVNPSYTVKHDKWGVIEVFQAPGVARNEPGYTEGAAAGKLSFAAPAMVLNGDFIGRAIVGPLQRQKNNLPAGGTFVIGLPTGVVPDIPNLDFRAPAIRLVGQRSPIGVGDDGSLASLSELELPTDFLRSGFQRADLYSNTTITVPTGVPLELLGGSTLNLRAQRIDVQSDVSVPGGTLTMTQVNAAGHLPLDLTPGIAIAPHVTLDVSGRWTNDTLAPPNDRPVDPVVLNAGSIQISTRTSDDSEIVIGSGAQFLANGGAWLKSNNTLSGGRGGQISIAASANDLEPQSALEFGDDIGIEAFGVGGASGGGFTLQAARLAVADQGGNWQHAQRVSQESGDAVEIGSSLFSNHGLASITLNAYGRLTEDSELVATLAVAPGTVLDTSAETVQLSADYQTKVTGTVLGSFSSRSLLPETDRLASKVAFNAQSANSPTNPRLNGAVVFGRDAQLFGDTGSSFSFSSGGGVSIDGGVRAHGGTIAISTTSLGGSVPYNPELQIDIGSHAQLDVSGTTLFPLGESFGTTGTIVSGGSISLAAERGSIVVQPGALLDFSGTQATLSLPDAARPGNFRSQVVAGDAGSVLVRAPESISLLGTLRGAAGQGETGRANGGSLDVQLMRFGTPVPDPSVQGTFPSNPRTILLTGDTAKSTTPLPSGLAILSDALIEAAGVDTLVLQTDGRIEIDAGTDLKLANSLTLDTPVLAMTSAGTANLHAPAVTLQNSRIADANATASSGAGSLGVSGDFIQLGGATVLQGIGSAQFTSTGDLRLQSLDVSSNQRGSLSAAGDLTLAAARVYGSTRTTFAVSAGAQDGTLRIEQTNASPGTPLSADSHLSFSAYDVVQNGTVLAPFGTISLNATHDLDLGAGSLTSASGADTLIPFGTIAVGGWVYQPNIPNTQVTTTPTRAVNLSAESVELAPGSTVDVSGGGDLYAYEWVPGTGGKQDALAAGKRPGLYAVLPSMRGQFAAPYDIQEYNGSDLQPGDSVYLSGGAGLEAGYYPLLPARYALLPGAVLVNAVTGFPDLAPGSTGRLVDGSTVVSGYRTFGTTGLGSARYSGFAVRSGSYGRLLAEYRDTLASSFFKLPADSEAIQSPLAPDAGTLSISVGKALSALGTVDIAGSGRNGLSGDLSLSATNLLVTGDSSVATAEDTTAIAATQLMSWKPGRLLLGGRRVDHGNQIDVTADTVEIGSGASLSLDEIVMIGRTSVSLDSGASVHSRSTDSGTPLSQALPTQEIVLTGAADAALLAVSDRSVLQTVRSSPGSNAGRITLAQGSELASSGALMIDATGGATLDGDMVGSHAQWLLGAGHIAFSEDPADAADGIVINQTLASRLSDARSLQLMSSAPVELRDSVTLGGAGLDSLVFSSGLSNLAPGSSASFTAGSMTLLGSGAAFTPSPGGTGQLALNTNQLLLQPASGLGDQAGSFLLDGFASTNIVAAREVRASGKVALAASGDVRIETSRMTAESASTARITAAEGKLTVAASSSPLSTPLEAAPLGGGLNLQAKSIAIDPGATVLAPSGALTLQATEDISIGSGATLNTAGRTVAFATEMESSFGGRITVSAGGALSIADGARLTADGGFGADAGFIDLSAGGIASVGANVLSATANGDGRGGSLSLEAGQFDNFGTLVATLGTGGFTEKAVVHVHDGDLALAAGTQLVARDVSLVTDAGQITVDGTISASSAAARSSLRLFGADGVTLGATGALLADNTSATGRGGFIELGSASGAINLASGGRISAQSVVGGGELWLRARATSDDVQIGSLNAALTGFDGVNIEAVRSTALAADPSGVDLDGIRSDAVAYSTVAKTNIDNRLGAQAGAPLRLRVGVELDRDGDLTLPDIDLSAWRTQDSQPIVLTARATGNLTVAGTISDGFRIVTNGFQQRVDLMTPDVSSPTPNASAAIRLVAGADLASVNPLAVDRNAAADLIFNDSTVVRTGMGSIDLVAARDVTFGPNASVYTAGSAGRPTIVPLGGQGVSTAFPTHGGDLTVRAGRDVLGQSSPQSVAEWLRRQGTANGSTRVGWGADITQFHWDLGTLGGGDLSIFAGRDALNLSAAASNSAYEAQPDMLTEFRGGNMDLVAGGDVGSGVLYAANGTARVNAGGGLTQTRQDADGNPMGTIFLAGNADIGVQSRLDARIAGVVSPTAVATPGVFAVSQPFFYTYGANTALHASSSGGDVLLQESDRAFAAVFGDDAVSSSQSGALLVLAPTLDLVSFSRDVGIASADALTLFPTDTGQLRLLGARDVGAAADPVGLAMSDAPDSSLSLPLNLFTFGSSISSPLFGTTSSRHANDAVPVVIAAGRDIQNFGVTVPKQTRMAAGRDILNTSLIGQNLNVLDVTSVSAGRDVIVTTLNPTTIEVGGPGRLDVLAGRNVDLGFSSGITTVGRVKNPLLPERGADITVTTGMRDGTQYGALVNLVMPGSQGYRDQLVAYVEKVSSTPNLSYDAAKRLFDAYDDSLKRPLADSLFMQELVKSGREQNTDPTLNFKRGYAAIDALFPGSRAKDATTYAGDLNMPLSRIYTIGGGDITLLVPGGVVDVGLANIPPTLPIVRLASDLGIVAQRQGSVNIYSKGSVLVNSSRVFTLLGGNIAIWSTFGDIDAGRGSKSAISAPPPVVLVDPAGNISLDFSSAVAGSGIRTILTGANVHPGDVDLIAPAGTVNAGDAGIGAAGNLNVAAQTVAGLDNIQVGGTSTGVPPETSGLGVSLAGASNTASSASSASGTGINESSTAKNAPVAESALGWLDVFVEGFGAEVCKASDVECLKRQKPATP